MKVSLYTDGGVRTGRVGGRSGRAAIAVVIRDEDNTVIFREGLFIGDATVNEAEYSAVIRGLFVCRRLGATDVSVFSDSQLVINQVIGKYRIKEQTLRDYCDELKLEAELLEKVTFNWIPREKNQYADQITREVLDA